MRRLGWIILGFWAATAFGQATAPVGRSLLRSDTVDVTVYDAAEGQSLNVKSNKGDAVAIISDSISWTPATEIDSEGEADPGEALWLEQGSKRLFYPNTGDRMPFSVYLVELKHHWSALMGYCSNEKKCTRPIKTGERTMGLEKVFFSNGQISAARYHLAKGGMFAETFSTEKSPCDVVVVALAPVTVVVNGESVLVNASEAHLFAKPANITFRADGDSGMWIAIRVPAQ